MSVLLNKNRIAYTKVIAVIFGIAVLLTQYSVARFNPQLHFLTDVIGYFLIAVCALGRLYCTVFLGGMKNKKVIDYGPFSVCRNPLYSFSLLGITGISIVSAHVTIMLFVPIILFIMYHFLVKREEKFLLNEFGQNYSDYCAKTPRFFPNFSLYSAPVSIPASPKLVLRGFFDAMAWFLAFPVIELIEMLHDSQILPVLFILP